MLQAIPENHEKVRDTEKDKKALKSEFDGRSQAQISEKSDPKIKPDNKFMQGYTDNLVANANYMGNATTKN